MASVSPTMPAIAWRWRRSISAARHEHATSSGSGAGGRRPPRTRPRQTGHLLRICRRWRRPVPGRQSPCLTLRKPWPPTADPASAVINKQLDRRVAAHAPHSASDELDCVYPPPPGGLSRSAPARSRSCVETSTLPSTSTLMLGSPIEDVALSRPGGGPTRAAGAPPGLRARPGHPPDSQGGSLRRSCPASPRAPGKAPR